MSSLPERVADLKRVASGESPNIKKIIEALSDPVRGVQEEVIALLVSCGDEVVPALEDAVQTGDHLRAAGALKAAIRLGRQGQPVVLKALETDDESLLLGALAILPVHILPEGIKSLAELFCHSSTAVRQGAAVLLAAARETGAADEAVDVLSNFIECRCFPPVSSPEEGESSLTREKEGSGIFLAAAVLGGLLGNGARDTFKKYFDSGDPSLIAVAAHVLGGSGGSEAIRDLVKLLQHPSSVVRTAAQEALIIAGREALPLLKVVLSKSSSALRERALTVMFRIMGERSGPLLTKMMAAGTELKLSALIALKSIREPGFIPCLVQALDDGSSLVVREARHRLIELGTLAVPPLCGHTSGISGKTLESICLVLGEIGRSSGPALARLLKQAGDPVKKEVIRTMDVPLEEAMITALTNLLPECGDAVRKEIAQKVGKSGEKAISPLVGIMLSEHVGVWYWAARALADTKDAWKSWLKKELKEEEPEKRIGAVKILGRMSAALPARELLLMASSLRPADIDLAVQEMRTCAPGTFYLSIVDDLETLKDISTEFLLKGLLAAAFPLVGTRVLDRLADEENPWVLQFLLGVVSGERLEEAMPLILSMLDHSETSVRYAAISALSGEPLPGKKGPLLNRIRETEGEERLRLLEALADLEDENVFSVLFSSYLEGDKTEREKIVSLLRANPSVKMIRSAVKRLAIEGGDRCETLQNLLAFSMVSEEQTEELKAIIQDRNPKVRSATYGILQKMGTNEAFSLLVQACRGEGDPVIYQRLFNDLIHEMVGGKSECRQLMEPYLKEMGAEAAIPLVQVLKETDSGDFLYMTLSQMVERIGEDALDVLDTLKEDNDRRIASISATLADNIRRSLLVGV